MTPPPNPHAAAAAAAELPVPGWLTGALSRTAPPSVWLGRACVGAIATLVAVISIERLRLFAIELNERDALALVPTLAEAAEELGPEGRLSEHPALARLDDGEWLGERVLRRHGYLFAVSSGAVSSGGVSSGGVSPGGVSSGGVSPGGVSSGADACWSVVAWPWEPGRSGHAVFAACSEHGLLGHPDAAQRLGAGGPVELACADADPAWRRLPRP